MEYITGMTEAAARRFMEGLGEKPYRGAQAVTGVWKNLVSQVSDITTFPKALRSRLAGALGVSPLKTAAERRSSDGTMKMLFSCLDDARIETVYIPSGDERRTVCVSSQTGCPFACAFCATGTLGHGRNLTAAEIAAQVWEMLVRTGEVSNVVFMGMGEPLLNVDNVVGAFRVLNDPACAGIGRRRMTISTVGAPSGIEKLHQTGEAVRLAVSLHSAVAETRRALVPGLSATPEEIVEAAFGYGAWSRQRVSFEMVLVAGLNDDRSHAEALADLLTRLMPEELRGMDADNDGLCRVNLIPCNAVAGLKCARPERGKIEEFRRVLERRGISATVRVEFGAGIEAACGQLTARSQPSTPKKRLVR